MTAPECIRQTISTTTGVTPSQVQHVFVFTARPGVYSPDQYG